MNKGKGFMVGQGEEVLWVCNRVNGGRALASFKFTTVYLIESDVMCIYHKLSCL